MRILVTGGAGFLGSHLCDALLERGHEVICLDNYFTGRKVNVAHHLGEPRFELMRHDVIDPFKVEVDWIFNLACPASPIHYQHNAIKTIKTSVVGAINCLGLAKRVGARLFHASTSEVYGDPEIHPQPESYRGHVNPIGPRACYDEGKRCAETLCFDYHRQNGVDIRVVRIFNTYGPRMLADDGRVVSNFIVQALRGEDITIYGDGAQTRSFCFVSDLIDGFLRFMEAEPEAGVSEDAGPKQRNSDLSSVALAKEETPKLRNSETPYPGPLNLGNPGEFTMLELAEKVLAKVGGPSQIVHHPLPEDDPRQRRPDITEARERLGWEPTVDLDEGLERTIAYFRS